MKQKATIIGLGSHTPEKKISNDYFVNLGLDTSNEWIENRTGISNRFYINDDESSIDLAYNASLRALEDAKITAKEIDLIIVATTTPDYLSFPSTACLLQKKLNTRSIMAFDLSAACSGFSYAINVASQFIENSSHNTVLVVGVDCLSRTLNFNDRTTCILFGDGAGAAILQATNSYGLLYSKSYSNGNEENALKINAGGSKQPLTPDLLEQKENTLKMDGKTVFKLAVNKTTDAIKDALQDNNLDINDVDYIICHQANSRILDKIQENLNIPKEKMLSNVKHYGNTSAASIPILLDESNQKKLFKKNDIILLAGFGAGFTWSINILKWNNKKE